MRQMERLSELTEIPAERQTALHNPMFASKVMIGNEARKEIRFLVAELREKLFSCEFSVLSEIHHFQAVQGVIQKNRLLETEHQYLFYLKRILHYNLESVF